MRRRVEIRERSGRWRVCMKREKEWKRMIMKNIRFLRRQLVKDKKKDKKKINKQKMRLQRLKDM